MRDDPAVEEAPESLAPDDRRESRDGGHDEEREAPSKDAPRQGGRLAVADTDGEREAERRGGVEEEKRHLAAEQPAGAREERREEEKAERRVVRPKEAEKRASRREDGSRERCSRAQTRTSSWSGP